MEIFLTILLIVVVGGWLLRRLLPLLLLGILSRAARRGGGGFYTNVPPTGRGGASAGRGEKKEGEVTIKVNPDQDKGVSKTIGEYVEYDEER